MKEFKSDNGNMIKIIEGGVSKRIEEVIEKTEGNNIKRESIFVFSPNNKKVYWQQLTVELWEQDMNTIVIMK